MCTSLRKCIQGEKQVSNVRFIERICLVAFAIVHAIEASLPPFISLTRIVVKDCKTRYLKSQSNYSSSGGNFAYEPLYFLKV